MVAQDPHVRYTGLRRLLEDLRQELPALPEEMEPEDLAMLLGFLRVKTG